MNNIIEEDINTICNENLDWAQLSDKNILVTGANGMLASYLIESILFLVKYGKIKNVSIIALMRDNEKAKLRFKNYLSEPCLRFIIQDVCDPIDIPDRINIIIHAASPASPKYYGIDPVGTINPNVIGTNNLLKFALEKQVEKFIYFSSGDIYGNIVKNGAIAETDFGTLDPMNIRACYAESKRMGETICASWYSQFNIPIMIIRPFHTYGPGLNLGDGRATTDFAFNIINSQNIEINSDGTAYRTYCYLTDAVIAYFYIIFSKNTGVAYNVGNPFQEYTVKELALAIIDLFPEKFLKIKINPHFHPPESIQATGNRLLPDIRKIQTLGWNPKVDIKTGFRRTILSYT